MKKLFLHAKSNVDLMPVVKKVVSKLHGSVGVFTTIQHLERLQSVLDHLSSSGVNVVSSGQILGCAVPSAKLDSVLYIGSGKFHPIALLLKQDTKVICADPFSLDVKELSKSDVEKIVKKQKGALLKFHSSSRIGVLVSVKSGQENFDVSLGLESKYPEKKFYYFAVDTLDFNEFENFSSVECYVNTMCPRIGFDDVVRSPKSMINLEEVI